MATPDWANRVTRDQRQAPESKRFFTWPDSLNAQSPWARWIEFLIRRYAGKVRLLGFVNEPNLECWPQDAGATTTFAECATIEMFFTARTVLNATGVDMWMAGPDTSDSVQNSPNVTPYHAFTSYVAQALGNNGFSDARFVWTHHNYDDVTLDLGADSMRGEYTLRAADVRNRLVGYFRGWPSANANAPRVWLTEGGAQRNKFGTEWPSGFNGTRDHGRIQQQLVARAWNRCANDDPGSGLGIAMFTNWRTYSDLAAHDTGLLDPYNGMMGMGMPRPVYSTWSALPGRV